MNPKLKKRLYYESLNIGLTEIAIILEKSWISYMVTHNLVHFLGYLIIIILIFVAFVSFILKYFYVTLKKESCKAKLNKLQQ